MRGRWLAFAAACLILGAWVAGASRPAARPSGRPTGAPLATRQPGPLRLLSLNMLHGFPRFLRLEARLALIAAAIQRLDPDVVCLQEVPWTARTANAAEDLAQLAGMNYLYARANGNRWAILFEEGEAILSRYPLRDARVSELRPRPGMFEHRVALSAVAETPWGPLRLVSTHLTNGAPEVNRGQAENLERLVQGMGSEATIIAGDFNAREESPQIRGLGWIDVFRATNPEGMGWTCCFNDPGDGEAAPSKRIDYVFLAPGDLAAEPVTCQVVPIGSMTDSGFLWASDHAALLAVLRLPPQAGDLAPPHP